MKQESMKQNGMKRQSGFTLIELMIVVGIIAILSTIAFGSYQDSVRKSKRAEAKTTLMDVAQRLERCYTANGNYDTACSVHDGTDLVPPFTTTEHTYYNLAIPTLTATTFTLTATATFPDPQCDVFSITHTGFKASLDDTATASTGCW